MIRINWFQSGTTGSIATSKDVGPAQFSGQTGGRRERFDVKGTIKGYWLNGALRSMWLGAANPATTGAGSTIYHSQGSFNRYQIEVVPTSVFIGHATPRPLTFVNVVLEKDAIKTAPTRSAIWRCSSD